MQYSQEQVFSCEYCEIFKNTYFEEDQQTVASVFFNKIADLKLWFCQFFENTFFYRTSPVAASVVMYTGYNHPFYTNVPFNFKKQPSDVFYTKKLFLKNFLKFTGKRLCWSFFCNKVDFNTIQYSTVDAYDKHHPDLIYDIMLLQKLDISKSIIFCWNLVEKGFIKFQEVRLRI